MLDPQRGFIPLPREKTLFTSPPRTAINLSTPNKYPGREPISISSGTGVAYLTNQRKFKSFSCPLLNFQDAHVSAPFFGPNVWNCVLLPVTGGGFPAQHTYVEMKLTFKDGGAFDFHTTFERIKESLAQAIETARESGRGGAGGSGAGGAAAGIDLSNVNLDQLPAYEEHGNTMRVPAPQPFPPQPPSQPQQQQQQQQPPSSSPQIVQPVPISPNRPRRTSEQRIAGLSQTLQQPQQATVPQPDEPPPGYEETQQSGVADRLEESVRRSS
ncbi:hypothetical protein MMC25_006572 [Agyrium rufum]|nr:hypothetical protein [Agyrium rufum]